MGIISIKNLVHRFSKYGDNGEEIGEKTALEQVSLDIEKGSFVAILHSQTFVYLIISILLYIKF